MHAKISMFVNCCRRDIANLGVIYRAVTRRGPSKLWDFFQLDTSARRTSPRWNFHRFRVLDPYRSLQRDYINRSALGFVSLFNLLPDCVFINGEEKLPISVKSFQSKLTSLLRFVCGINERWQELFCSRQLLTGHVLHT